MEKDISNKWLEKYNLAKEYYEKHGNLLIPYNYYLNIDGKRINLGHWIHHQRQAYNDKLSNDQIIMLNKIGMVWQVISSLDTSYEWIKNYDLAKDYYQKHGNLLIPKSYSLTVNDEVLNLGMWIATQRQLYKNGKLNEQRIMLLNKIGMIWEAKLYRQNNTKCYISDKWLEKYNFAKAYYEEHGDLLIPQNYSLFIDEKKINLGSWIKSQRQLKSSLNKEQIYLLNKIDMVWEVRLYENNNVSDKWLESYNLAKDYYEKHGNLFIAQNYYLINDNKIINLGMWIHRQRNLYKNNKLNNKKIDLLDKIGMVWKDVKMEENESNEFVSALWMNNYLLSKKYFNQYNNLLVPQGYVMEFDSNKFNLFNWIEKQRKLYKNGNLSKKQIELLDKIDMIWDIKQYINYQKYIDQIYMLYMYNKLNEKQLDDILKNKVFIYKDDSFNKVSKK